MKKRALAVLLAFSMVIGNTSYLYAAEQEDTQSVEQEAVQEEDGEQTDPDSQKNPADEETVQLTQEEGTDSSEPEDDLQKTETKETEEPVATDILTAELPDKSVVPGEKEGQEPEDLFSAYVDSVFNGRAPLRKKAARSTGSRLTGNDAAVYAKIAGEIPAIAAGQEASTIFTVSAEELGLEQTSWTAKELGMASVVVRDDQGNVTGIAKEAIAAVQNKTDFDLHLVISSLLADFPYDLYWYEKTQPTQAAMFGVGASYDPSIGEYLIRLTGVMQLSFPVAEDFSAGEYTVNTAVGQSVQASVQKAQSIVSQYASASDREKLQGYKNEICDLVSYNNAAAGGGVNYGNPWQMIWVFDDDPETKVVCEGYAKAFKYLCDKSSFSGDISCITVSGTMKGGTGEGPHMWNIVLMDDGSNYLVDVTNCDEGTVGASDQLFLALSKSGDVESGYVFGCESHDISYVYDEDMMQLYTENELVIGPRVEETAAQILSASVSFMGKIGLNYYIDIPEEYLEDSDAYVEYTIDKLTPETSKINLSEIPAAEIDGNECRKLTVDTVVKSINDKITLHIYDGEGNKIKLLSAAGSDITDDGFVYSVAGYCDDIAKQSSSATMKDLAYKLKQYGLYVQKYLDYKADEAQPSMDVSSVTAEMLNDYKGSRTAEVEGLTFIGFSFLFKEESALRYKFKLAEGNSIEDYTFTVDGNPVTPSFNGSQYVIEVRGIRARDLEKEYPVKVTAKDGSSQTLSYSGLSYAKALIEKGSSEAAKNAAKAMYLYYKAAVAYFGN